MPGFDRHGEDTMTNRRWWAAALGAALLAATVAGCGDDDPGEPTPATIELKFLGRYASGIAGGAEIVAYDPGTKRVFTVNGAAGTIDVLDLANPASPAKVATISVSDVGAGANSVAVRNGLVALAVEAKVKTDPGLVLLYRASDLARLGSAAVGALPDMLTFTPDGRFVVVANEGEPNDAYTVDPEGSVSIVDVRDPAKPTVRTAGFAAFNGQADALRAAGVRIYGPNATVAQDLEPEYVAVSDDSRTAWVTLQENNALAIVDLEAATVKEIVPLGYKNHAAAGNGLDPSDRDNATAIAAWPVFGMYQPDAIASFTRNGTTYLVTANEGDARGWTGFNEEARVSSLTLSPTAFPDSLCGGPCRDASRLGRLNVTTALGRNPDGSYGALYAYGARSFSIWDSRGKLVWDSGDQFEKLFAANASLVFNASHDDNTRDSRSDNKGPEPEAVVVARFGEKFYAFVGLERVGGVMVFDVTTPTAPAYVTYLNSRDFTKPTNDPAAGDLGPEGLHFVPASASPNGKPLLLVGNEISGTTAILQIDLKF
jgi:hypothetical protein